MAKKYYSKIVTCFILSLFLINDTLFLIKKADAAYKERPDVSTATGILNVENGGTGSTLLGSTLTNSGGILNTTIPTDREITLSTDIISSTDNGKTVVVKRLGGSVVSLPASTSTGFGQGYGFSFVDLSGGSTIAIDSGLIDNVKSLNFIQNEGCFIRSSGGNYRTSFCPSIYDHNPIWNTDTQMLSVDSRISRTNSTGGYYSYFNSSGTLTQATTSTERISYKPSDLSYRGILIEGTATNTRTYSQIGTGWGGLEYSTTTNSTTSPAGTADAALLKDTTANNSHYTTINNALNTINGHSYVFSGYFKSQSQNIVQLALPGTCFVTGAYANFNATDCSTSTKAAAVTSYAENVGNGWCRFAAVSSAIADCTNNNGPYIALTNNNPSLGRLPVYSGTAGGFYVYGVQTEEGTYPTSYISTAGSVRNRSADIVTITSPYWLSNSEGTACATFSTLANKAGAILSSSSGSNTLLSMTSTSYGANDGTTAMDFSLAQISAGTKTRMCARWSASSGYANAAVNGVLGTQSPFDGSMGITADINVFRDYNGENRVDGYLQNVKFFNYALMDNQMISESTP